MIRFLSDASEYGRFNEGMVQHILPHLPKNARICDAGCGLGYLSLALAPHCREVVAVDAEESVLTVLKGNLARRKVINVTPVQGDLFAMQPETPYDAMVFCFFGGAEETLAAVKAQCRGKAFLIKKNWDTHRFTRKEKPLEKFTFKKTCEALDNRNVPYETASFPLEMGQPFRSLSDAETFFSLYGGPVEAGQEQSARADVLSRLRETGDGVYPYYLPSCRPLGMVILDGEILRKTPGL